MALASKRTQTIVTSERIFVGREREKNILLQNLTDFKKDANKILVFYGLGGIGKSTLCRELKRLINYEERAENWIIGGIDFDDRHNFPNPKEDFTAPLRHLAMDLSKRYKFNFRRFDLAYAFFWKNSFREQEMKGQSWIAQSEILSEVMEAAGDIPFVGAIPHLARVFNASSRILKDWWEKSDNNELKTFLSSDNPHSSKQKQKLLYFFTDDLNQNLNQTQKRLVVFLDTYERFLEDSADKSLIGILENDAWVRDLIRETPGVLWTIMGREKLRWYEVDEDFKTEGLIEQHQLGGLKTTETIILLEKGGIKDTDLQKLIIQVSKSPDSTETLCYPYNLDLCLEMVNIASSRGIPVTAELLGQNTNELSRRFLMWLDTMEINTLKVLSVPRYWNDDLAKLLINEFKTGYPIINLNTIKKYSFIQQPGEKTFKIHGIMQQCLNHTFKEDVKEVHRFLAGYYHHIAVEPRLPRDITETHLEAFSEGYYHQKNILTFNELFLWLRNISTKYFAAQKHELLITILSDFIKYTEQGLSSFKETPSSLYIVPENDHSLSIPLAELFNSYPEVILGYSKRMLGEILNQKAKFAQAEIILEQSLSILEKFLQNDPIEWAQSIFSLAQAKYCLGKFDESEKLFLKVVELKIQGFGNEHPEVASIHNCAATGYMRVSKWEEAENLLRKAIDIWNKVLEKDIKYDPCINQNIPSIDFCVPAFAKNMLPESSWMDHATEKSEKYIDLASTLNNLGDVCMKLYKFPEAEKLMNQALELRIKMFGKIHPSVAYTFMSLGKFYLELENLDKAEEMLQVAMETANKSLGEMHPRYALSLHLLAQLKSKKEDFTNALNYAVKALSIRQISLAPDHPDTMESKAFVQKLMEI